MSAQPEQRTVGRLMGDLLTGDQEAAGKLMELLYPELRRLAAAKMRGERTDHTWQPTVLVNELYLQLLRTRPPDNSQEKYDKNAFFGLAAHMMTRLLIHHARPLHRRVNKVPIPEAPSSPEFTAEKLDDIEALLTNLGTVDPQLRTIVEMKVFEGLSVEEIAAALRCSKRTVERRWTFAKHWLEKELA